MVDDTRFLHGKEFSLGNSQLVRIQVAGIDKNQRARTSEKVVANWMARQRGGEIIREENLRKF